MIVRALDGDHDWTFGQGLNNYLKDQNAVAQDINTRLNSFLGDCFFDQGAGINWFGFIGSKESLALNLAISAVILNTLNVLSINQLYVRLTAQRAFSVAYDVQTSFSQTTGTVQVTI